MSKQPEALALQLADSAHLGYRIGWQRNAAAELRRLYAFNDELREALQLFCNAAEQSETALDFSIKCDMFIENARAALKKATEAA